MERDNHHPCSQKVPCQSHERLQACGTHLSSANAQRGWSLGSLQSSVDPLQFSYKTKRGVEDTSPTLMDRVTRHLDSPNSYVRILFVDFSSAVNTVKANTLLHHLQGLQVNTTLVLWIKDFLKDRPQHVRVDGFKSRNIVLNTEIPQGWVLSPILFSIYTLSLFKYADDMALVAP